MPLQRAQSCLVLIFFLTYCVVLNLKDKLKSNTSIFKRSNGLLHNKSACQEYFMKNNTVLSIFFFFFFGKFHALKFWEKQFWEEIWIFWLIISKNIKKYLGRPYTLESLSGVQPNNFFFFALWWIQTSSLCIGWCLSMLVYHNSYSRCGYLCAQCGVARQNTSMGRHQLM